MIFSSIFRGYLFTAYFIYIYIIVQYWKHDRKAGRCLIYGNVQYMVYNIMQ